MSFDQEHCLKEFLGAARDLPLRVRSMFLEWTMRLWPQVERLLRPPELARGSAGKSVRPCLRPSGGWLLAAILLVLAGCTTYRTERPKGTDDVPLLAPLQPGKTTRQELARDWGPPSASLQQGRIVFYRLEGKGNRLRFSEETGSWRRSRHSVVLIFSTTGILEKSSLVRIR